MGAIGITFPLIVKLGVKAERLFCCALYKLAAVMLACGYFKIRSDSSVCFQKSGAYQIDMKNMDPNNDAAAMAAIRKVLLSKNRLYVTVIASQNGKPVEGLIPKTFLSGNSDTIKDVLDMFANTVNAFTEPYDAKSFAAFVLGEIDDVGRFRKFSAEKKWVFDFMENEYKLGDYFEITMTSLLAPGATDQRFLLAAQNFVRKSGKVIKLTYSFHNDAFAIKGLRTLIK